MLHRRQTQEGAERLRLQPLQQLAAGDQSPQLQVHLLDVEVVGVPVEWQPAEGILE